MSAYLRRAMELPPHVAALKATKVIGRLVQQRVGRRRDLRGSTFADEGPLRIGCRLSLTAKDVPPVLAKTLPKLTQQYLEHRFDLLGSGWVQVRYGMSADGLEGHRYPAGPAVEADREGRWLRAHITSGNLPEARRIWRLIDGPYEPIDWQIDFKSGFRWDGKRHFRDLSYGNMAGADVKVPWELSRLQHLPQLAIAHLLAKADWPGFYEPAVYTREVRNQIIDFLATNPPRFGVNWLCPMDVGIRAANIALSIDLLKAGGAEIDAISEAAMARSLTTHARHILSNLEWSMSPRSNHYLSDLAGVLFCALYLPADAETDAWLDFAAQQLSEELISQFLPDGGNFEGSTNYHRLSAEIGLFSSAALLGVYAERACAFRSAARHRLRVRPPLGSGTTLNTADTQTGAPLPPTAVERLHGAVACVADWIKPNGRAPQVGDTDSGRLFKLHPVPATLLLGQVTDDVLDHRAMLSAGSALFDRPAFNGVTAHDWLDGVIVRALAGGGKLRSAIAAGSMPEFDIDALSKLVAEIRALPPLARRETAFDLPGLAPDQLRQRFFQDFGLLVLRGEKTYLSLRCFDKPAIVHTMGHYHDDNLALELNHDGVDLIADPGSYLYTPLKSTRDRYRNASAHFVPRPEDRSAFEFISPFATRCNARARLVHCGPTGFGAVLEGPDWKAYRAVLIETGRLTVFDGCSPGILAASLPVPVSEGYGRPSELTSTTGL
jgi:hypothetical protein